MPTPMMTSEPWGRLQSLADVYTQAGANDASRVASMQAARGDDLDFAAKIMTSGPALSAFGGGQIGSLATQQGNLAEGLLSGAYTGAMDNLRLAAAVPGAGRGGGGGGPAGPKPYKVGDDTIMIRNADTGEERYIAGSVWNEMVQAGNMGQGNWKAVSFGVPASPGVAAPSGGASVEVGPAAPDAGYVDHGDGTYTLPGGSRVDAQGNPI